MRTKLREVKTTLIKRRDLPIPEQARWLASVLRGHCNYYAVPENYEAINAFRQLIIRHWLKALRRRSQRTRLTWQRMYRLAERWLPTVRSCTPGPNHAFTPKPKAGAQCVNAHAGICAGGRPQRRSLPRLWTVLGAVDQMDLDRFREGYRLGGSGRAPYDPAMLVALLLYAYARGNRSSRRIERACLEDVAYKVITSMRVPDHSTIAEFRRRHEAEIAELFDQVLGLCREAGLVSVGVIMVDGTKIKANASMDQNRSYAGVVREILREAEETDRREDELYGDARGDELPEQLRTATAASKRSRTPSGGSRSAKAARSGRGSPSGMWRWIPSWCSVGVAGGAGGVSGLGSRAASSSRGGSVRPSRSRATERTVCSRRSVGWRRTTGSISPPTTHTSAGAQALATRSDGS